MAVACKGTNGAIVEVNAETDFVGRNESFQKFTQHVAELARNVKGSLEPLKKESLHTGKTVEEELTHLVATIGENMTLRRAAYLEVPHGVVMPYMHNATAPGLGRLGVLVALESSAPHDKLEATAKQIAMHVAAARPLATRIAEVDPAEIDRERAIFKEQALASGKPAEFVDKMVEGRLRKFYEEVVLEEQVFVMDGKTRVKDVLTNLSKELGKDVKIAGFIRFGLGEGIKKKKNGYVCS